MNSSRPGKRENSDLLSGQFVSGARNAGHRSEKIFLNKKNDMGSSR
ncbi:MAG: hypothetical protein HGB20_03580 [Chlorobiaceae bacterium]|nr:hypothetical protein [Chlorobiaceae bacterium]